MNCWEYMKCGREPGGSEVAIYGVCPAYPNWGQRCARVAGTLNGKEAEGLFINLKEIPNCNHCSFYNSEHYIKGLMDLVK